MKALSSFPCIMGILNVTPDSFYDGGEYAGVHAAVERIKVMLQEGADIIDVGGQSTLEVDAVSAEEECTRVLPVIEAVKAALPQAVMSVDTYKAEVARRALESGANIVNDVSGGRMEPEILEVVAKAQCPYIMMHCKDAEVPTKICDVQYDDVVQWIVDFFAERIAVAEAAGIRKENLILDPGLGHFISSDPTYSWQILESLDALRPFGCPILVSPSRKSFTAEHKEQPPAERLPGTLKASRLALEKGAAIIRTHDVEETKALISAHQ